MDVSKLKSVLNTDNDQPVALSPAQSASILAWIEANETGSKMYTQDELDTAVSDATSPLNKKISDLTAENQNLTTEVESLKADPAAEETDPKKTTQDKGSESDSFKTSVDDEVASYKKQYN